MPHSPLDISEQEIRKRCGPLLEGAIEEATRLRHNFIGTEHVFNALTRIPGSPATRMLMEIGLEPREVRNAIRREVGAGDDMVSDFPPLTPRAHRVLAMAVYLADDAGDRFVSEEQLLLALLQEGEGIAARKLNAMGVDIVEWIERLLSDLDDDGDDDDDFEEFLFADMDSVMEVLADDASDSTHRMPTPLLDKYGRDLTEQAREAKIGPAIGRDKEIRIIARTLTRSKKNNPLLLGDSGVGKTAVIEGLAYNIAHGLAPKFLLNRRIVQIEIGMLVAGTSLRGQFEERIVGIVDEAKNAPDVILFIDEIHTIVGAGDTIDSNLDAANILKPALARGEITCIGATTFEEYRKAIAKDPALDRRFRTIDIGEQSVSESLVVVNNVYQRYEEHHKVTILPEAREAAVRLSDRYMRDRRLPDKALDLLDEACARLVIQSTTGEEETTGPREVTAHTVTEVLSEWTGIPVSELTANERKRFAHMADALRERVIGQEHAVTVLSDAIKASRAGLGDPRRPVGVFLFLGPSGVGKTELAKTLAAFLFNDENAIIRLDMSEFHDEHTVARLIGAPPGYKGMEQGGQLTEALRRKPFSVVLLDEVEKAAPEVFDIFLQVFDEGRLTDSQGATVDARHSAWIMTSNIGTGDVGKGLGFGATPDQLPDYDFHLKKHFRPEFLNRLDEVVVFSPLTAEALNGILDLQLRDVRERLVEQKLTLTLDDGARELLLTEGYDPANGARPLRRAIERLLTRPLSTALLEETFGPGDAIQVTRVGDGLALQLDETTRASDSSPDAADGTTALDDADGTELARADAASAE
ncbi:MAG: ATP-dependent Clp protease ATP-binding subunit [Chloroflexi bacterium]|nr:ATP-dependent Clp protease ATP-binding subunit [Chloroflexota bacterium]